MADLRFDYASRAWPDQNSSRFLLPGTLAALRLPGLRGPGGRALEAKEGADGTIWWVRHGPTHARGMVGWSDLPADLSDTAALSRLSRALPGNVPVISSDLSRTIATAGAIVGDRPRLAPIAALREMHFGEWELRRHAEIEAEQPERIRAFFERPGEVRPPGGESWTDLSDRVRPAVDALLQEHGRLIIVAHFGVILSELQNALGWDTDQTFAQKIEPLSLTRIVYGATPAADPINHIP